MENQEAQVPQGQTPQPEKSSLGLDAKLASLLCYIPLCAIGLVMGVVLLIAEKESKFVKFHAAQSLVLHIALMILCIAFWIAGAVLGFVLGPLALLAFLMNILIVLAFIVIMIIMMVKSYAAQIYKLPIVGDYAEKLSGGKKAQE